LVRLLCGIGVGAVLLVQPASALASPSPSPSLDKILVAPPGTGFVEQPKSPSSGLFEGEFDAAGKKFWSDDVVSREPMTGDMAVLTKSVIARRSG